MKGFFGNLFDFDRDGKLNVFERTMDFMAFQDAMSAGKEEESSSSPVFASSHEEAEEQENELEEAGIDPFDFEYLMDDDEKKAALEEAGLDPWDYDLYL